MALHGQPVVATPFTLAGAMSPVSLAGALAQQNAEALAQEQQGQPCTTLEAVRDGVEDRVLTDLAVVDQPQVLRTRGGYPGRRIGRRLPDAEDGLLKPPQIRGDEAFALALQRTEHRHVTGLQRRVAGHPGVLLELDLHRHQHPVQCPPHLGGHHAQQSLQQPVDTWRQVARGRRGGGGRRNGAGWMAIGHALGLPGLLDNVRAYSRFCEHGRDSSGISAGPAGT